MELKQFHILSLSIMVIASVAGLAYAEDDSATIDDKMQAIQELLLNKMNAQEEENATPAQEESAVVEEEPVVVQEEATEVNQEENN